jgi:hypothetical protein
MSLRHACFVLGLAAACAAEPPELQRDRRLITTGLVIPDEGYSDQPYIAKASDGAWVCAITTGPGVEGASGQHVVTRRSTDMGRTWSDAVAVEPASGPEASYAVLLATPGGRMYVFYNHNTDNTRSLIADKPAYPDGLVRRVDSQGHFVFKYSDDQGRTWSAQRYEIPQRDFEIDRKNPYQGRVKFFWNVGRAFAYRGAGYVPLHKVGGFGEGFFTSSEGVLLRSRNILTERDPAKIGWETLPDGEIGIRTPAGGGPVAEEQSFSELSDGSLFCVFRTIDGHSACTYSRDGGRTWEPSQYMRYGDGRLMKHPRAANFAWRCENGKFLYWFHNHGGRFIREHPNRRTIAYEDRNPVWLSGGVEADTARGKVIRWSQPEIALYDDDPLIRMSYPDLVEDGGSYYVTETQKDVARVHELDAALVQGLWRQFDGREVSRDGLMLDQGAPMPATVKAAPLPPFYQRSKRGDYGKEDLRAGFTLDLWTRLASAVVGQVLLDNRTPEGKGLALATGPGGTYELVMNDGWTESRWRSDPGTVQAGKIQHVAVVVDGGPKIITFVIDGILNDGGDSRQFGWGRFSPNLRSAAGGAELRIDRGAVQRLRIYNRYLRTSEAIANFRAGM